MSEIEAVVVLPGRVRGRVAWLDWLLPAGIAIAVHFAVRGLPQDVVYDSLRITWCLLAAGQLLFWGGGPRLGRHQARRLRPLPLPGRLACSGSSGTAAPGETFPR